MNGEKSKEPIRVILHFDMDCYYASAEMVRNPSLYGKPVGILQNKCICTTNYVARGLGVFKMSFYKQAKEICPNLVVIPADMDYYQAESRKVWKYVRDSFFKVHTKEPESSLVQMEVLGLDEINADITKLVMKRLLTLEEPLTECPGYIFPEGKTFESTLENQMLWMGGVIASELRTEIATNFGYTGSAGVSHNIMLAKLVGNEHKPASQTTLMFDLPFIENEYLAKRSIRDIPNIGRITQKKMNALSIHTMDDLVQAHRKDPSMLINIGHVKLFVNLAQGIDTRPISFNKGFEKKSLMVEVTFPTVSTMSAFKPHLANLVETFCYRVRLDFERHQRVPTVVQLRWGDRHRHHSLSVTLNEIIRSRFNEVVRQKGNLKDHHATFLSYFLNLFLSQLPHPFHVFTIGLIFHKFVSSNARSRQLTLPTTHPTPGDQPSSMMKPSPQDSTMTTSISLAHLAKKRQNSSLHHRLASRVAASKQRGTLMSFFTKQEK